MILYLFLAMIVCLIYLAYLFLYQYHIKLLISDKELFQYHNKIKIFEKKMSQWYPLNSTECFKIDHGNNYYKFFKRMGKIYASIVLNKNDEIIGTFIGILRYINNTKIWYLCDLKIDQKYRGNWIPYKILKKNFLLKSITNKFYAITMSNKENKVIKISKKMANIFGINIKIEKLKIYMVSSQEMKNIRNILELIKGKLYFTNINKYKSLIIKSTTLPLKLYHVNFKKNNNNQKELESIETKENIDEDYLYMFCFHCEDQINNILESNNIKTNIFANVIHNIDFKVTDWDFIQTSEI